MIYKNPAVYIIANKPNGTIDTGVTSNLIQRVYQHKHGFVPVKGGSRNAKLALIKSVNPNWQDLYQKII
jgi:predicted GIY-YIG superfamily endonuclease